jgi:hypothetical protein
MRSKAEARKTVIDGDRWKDTRGAIYEAFNVGYQIRLELTHVPHIPWYGTNIRFMSAPTWRKWTARAEYLGGVE